MFRFAMAGLAGLLCISLITVPSAAIAQVNQGQDGFTATPGGLPGTPLGAQSPDATPSTGPMSYGQETTPQGSQSAGMPGGPGAEFPTSRGNDLPTQEPATMGQGGQGTGTDSTLGGSGTGTGGLSNE